MHTPALPDRDCLIYLERGTGYCVPTEKRIRAYVDETPIIDTRNARIVRMPHSVPVYAFPEDEINSEVLSNPSSEENDLGVVKTYDLIVNGVTKSGVAQQYVNPSKGAGVLKGLYTLKWNCIDSWMEEDEIISTHARDPYTRIDVRESNLRLEVWIEGEKIAETDRPKILFETGLPARYYLPSEDVKMNFLFPSELETSCPYKGKASYWDAKINGKTLKNIAWSYMKPFDESVSIENHFSFYVEKVDWFLIDGKNIATQGKE